MAHTIAAIILHFKPASSLHGLQTTRIMVVETLPPNISGFHLDPSFYDTPFDSSRIAMDDIRYHPETDAFSANEYPVVPRETILRILEAMSESYYLCMYPVSKYLVSISTVAEHLDTVIEEPVDTNEVIMACGIVGLLMLDSDAAGVDKFVYLARKNAIETAEDQILLEDRS